MRIWLPAVAIAVGTVIPIVNAREAIAGPTPTFNLVIGPPGGADGPSDNPAFSQDNRDVRLLAFDSAATNLVPGDSNGRRDVFVFRKARGRGRLNGLLSRVSVSASGMQANGDSSDPALDGTTGWSPRCVAFVSAATNLVPEDRSPDADVYVRNVRGRTTTLVSVRGRAAGEPAIDGRCRFVAYDSLRQILVRDLAERRTVRVALGAHPDLQTDGRGVVYERGGQVYYRVLRIRRSRLAGAGRERLVSDTRLGAPGNGASSNPVVDDHGTYVAFESTATDLCTARCQFLRSPSYETKAFDPSTVPSGDANGPISDIFRRSLSAKSAQPGAMVLMSYDYGHHQADAPSFNPAISRAGQEVVFESAADNVGAIGRVFFPTPGYTNIFSSYASGNRHRLGGVVTLQSSWADAEGHAPVNGSSIHPAMSSRANYVAFTSTEWGTAGELNGPAIPDVFLHFVLAGSGVH